MLNALPRLAAVVLVVTGLLVVPVAAASATLADPGSCTGPWVTPGKAGPGGWGAGTDVTLHTCGKSLVANVWCEKIQTKITGDKVCWTYRLAAHDTQQVSVAWYENVTQVLWY